ncbi:MAG: hypothetical protein HY320_04420 [Armatimonadetes bacterium]|nr:hypothetical protein [Armatimonadota bacterium]
MFKRGWIIAAAAVAALGLSLAVARLGRAAPSVRASVDRQECAGSALALASQGEPQPAVRPDPAVEAWVQTLVGRIADRSPVISNSVRQALVVVGRPALPALRKVAAGSDTAAADVARRLIAGIQAGRPGGPGGFPGGPGGPPGGPGGPGFPGQGPGGPGGFLGPIGAVLGDLDLTQEQQRAVDEILRSHQEKSRALFRQAQEGSQRLLQEMMAGLKGVLTDEQYKKVEEALTRPGRGPGGPGGFPGGPGGPPGNRRPPNGGPGASESAPPVRHGGGLV